MFLALDTAQTYDDEHHGHDSWFDYITPITTMIHELKHYAISPTSHVFIDRSSRAFIRPTSYLYADQRHDLQKESSLVCNGISSRQNRSS